MVLGFCRRRLWQGVQLIVLVGVFFGYYEFKFGGVGFIGIKGVIIFFWSYFDFVIRCLFVKFFVFGMEKRNFKINKKK